MVIGSIAVVLGSVSTRVLVVVSITDTELDNELLT